MSAKRLMLATVLVVLVMVVWQQGYFDLLNQALTTVTVGHEVVHYCQGASRADAQAVGEFLSSMNFSPDHRTRIQISKPDGHYVVSYPGASMGDIAWVSDMLMLTMGIANEKFGGAPIEMVLVDRDWKPMKTFMLAMNHSVPFHNSKATFSGKVWYGEDVTAEQAGQAASALAGTEQNSDVGLSKSPNGAYVLWMMQSEGWDKPEAETWARYLATQVAQAGVSPLATIQLCGGGFYQHKTLDVATTGTPSATDPSTTCANESTSSSSR